MQPDFLIRTLASTLAIASPLVFASVGETLTQKSGVINLSMDGTILLSAMVGFAVAFSTGSVALGFLVAPLVGAAIALIVAVASIELYQDQVAIGFVLWMTTVELSSFFGSSFVWKPGPSVGYLPLPGLSEIPVLGTIFFKHDPFVYASFLLVLVVWFWMFKTRPGLEMRSVGERPEAASARGIDVNKLRYMYTILGGALVGLAGAGYSLDVKLGWSYHHTFGMGWLGLAIVIFGGWNPVRAALGAYFFGALQSMGSLFQGIITWMPTQAFQVAPYALMIIVLLLVSSERTERFLSIFPERPRRILESFLRVKPPAALGTRFEQE